MDTILEYSEKEDGPVTALVFIKRRDGRGMACVGGFVQLGEFDWGEVREGGEESGRGREKKCCSSRCWLSTTSTTS